MSYTLQLLTYSRGLHPIDNTVLPYHWALLLLPEPLSATGTVYQLRGMPGGFHYDGPEPNSDVTKVMDPHAKPKVVIEIGEVPFDKLGEFESIMGSEDVSKKEYGWNCQDWTVAVLEKVEGRGWLHESLTVEGIKAWLREG